MTEPIFWLGLSLFLVAGSLTAVLVAALPAFQELARAARSAEKLFDTLSRELPPTLEAIRLTGMELTDLTDDVSEGVQSATRVVKQVNQGFGGVRRQTKKAQGMTRSVMVGLKAAWRTFNRSGAQRSPDLPLTEHELEAAYPDYLEYPNNKAFPYSEDLLDSSLYSILQEMDQGDDTGLAASIENSTNPEQRESRQQERRYPQNPPRIG